MKFKIVNFKFSILVEYHLLLCNRQFLITNLQLLRCARDALDYIDDRREFWRKQQPVYSRINVNKKK